MAKVVKKKQPLRVAGKVATTEADAPKKVAPKKVAPKKVAPKKAEVAENAEVAELTVAEQEQLEKEAQAKKSKAKAKKEKAEQKLKDEADAIANCGYKVGDVTRTKNGSEKEITKITSRAQGVHLWWETLGGISAGGNYTSRVLGKVVKGKLVDPITGEVIEVAEKPKKKVAKKTEVAEVTEEQTNQEEE